MLPKTPLLLSCHHLPALMCGPLQEAWVEAPLAVVHFVAAAVLRETAGAFESNVMHCFGEVPVHVPTLRASKISTSAC